MEDVAKFWSELLPLLEKSFTKPIYGTLLSSVVPVSETEGKFTLAVSSDVIKDWLTKHCQVIIEQEINELDPSIRTVELIVGPKDLFNTPLLETAQATVRGPAPTALSAYLNPRYTFDDFVIGNGNRFAHAAAQAVAETPAKAYNPLFLYGGVGLGKTHLMQAIGHFVLKANPKASVLYITSEIFTNDLINSIRDDRTQAFRNKYRSIDVLLVDDIQFLAGKERTQEEFFHTFNTLYEAHKQIVVSSDRPPKEIPTLEERLRSRFEWGLIADIQPPDFETRVAILKKKAELVELSVSDEILSLIASKVTSNIRELEGSLIRVVAFASLTSSDINIALVEHVLKDILAPTAKPSLSIDLIKKVAAEYYSIKIDDMTAKIRTREIATARQVAMYLVRTLTDSSLPKIGDEFGGRDHTTVMHACEKIATAIKEEPKIEEAVKAIKFKLKKYIV